MEVIILDIKYLADRISMDKIRSKYNSKQTCQSASHPEECASICYVLTEGFYFYPQKRIFRALKYQWLSCCGAIGGLQRQTQPWGEKSSQNYSNWHKIHTNVTILSALANCKASSPSLRCHFMWSVCLPQTWLLMQESVYLFISFFRRSVVCVVNHCPHWHVVR